MKRFCAALLASLVAVSWAGLAQAQGQFGPGIQPGIGPGSGPPPPAAGGGGPPPGVSPEGMPETHAASGGESLLPPSSEPSLPDNPLRIKPSIFKRIGTDSFADDEETGRTRQRGFKPKRQWYGLWYQEQDKDYRLRGVFPFWMERTKLSLNKPGGRKDRASLYGLYYNRRSEERSDDVLFPLFWNMRDKTSRTTVVGPVVNRVAPGEKHNWLAPLYFIGSKPRGGYTIIPPLLTWLENDAEGGLNIVGPAFCSWKGGSVCDTRTADSLTMGLAPFYFYSQSEQEKTEVIPPLLHYYHYDDRDLSWTNIWGPYYREQTQTRDYLHLLPLYWSIRGRHADGRGNKQEHHTTLLPFFHYGTDGKSSLFVNPLYLTATGSEGEKTFVTWGYARYRGRTELDMITPLWWHFRDPDIGLDQKLLFPFYYRRTSPREDDIAFFPFYGHFHRHGIKRETWITPFFQHTTDLRGWSTNLHPILYLGRNGYRTHTVVAPIFWDFAGRSERMTVAFPFYWRFSDRYSVNQLVGNVYYHEKKLAKGLDWELHFFPFFTYGETPDGHWWNVLYGLAGYTRRGTATEMRTFWVPFELSK